ncbi:MAG: hypothetical protein HKN91_16450 [Acidimicrobiia bacterium]|nr:hypothetical protein [Acidimicrobiia bacterium]
MNRRSTLGWKHRLVSTDDIGAIDLAGKTTFVTLSKNPYSWAISMWRRPYHAVGEAPTDLAAFVAAEWPTVRRERGPKRYRSLTEMWNAKNRAYIDVADSFPTVNLRYEDLLRDPFEVIERVRLESAADRNLTEYKNIVASAKGDSEKGYSFYRQYYLNEEWRSEMDDSTIERMNSDLDRDLMERLGYDILEPDNNE